VTEMTVFHEDSQFTAEVVDLPLNFIVTRRSYKWQYAHKLGLSVVWSIQSGAWNFDTWICYKYSMRLKFIAALKMETVCFLETLVSIYRSTWRHNQEDHRHRRENLKSHRRGYCFSYRFPARGWSLHDLKLLMVVSYWLIMF